MRLGTVRAFGAVSWLTTIACSRAPADFDSHQAAILNGADDRLELFQTPREVEGPLLGASAALVHGHRLLEQAPDSVALRALPASDALDLCADEPFASQPVAAFCSGVLIDDDLLATAGHCFPSDAERAGRRCGELRVVFGFVATPNAEPIELRAERVFACRRVVVLDSELAIVQLDRAVSAPLSPRPITVESARKGDPVLVASHGAGLPLKVELAAEVTQVSESGALVVAMDTFAGSSGGGLYDSALALVGLVASGVADWEAEDGCSRAAHSDVPRERASSALRVPRAVCDSGWPSARLCGTPSDCGDGICSADEARQCSDDCAAPRCGDSLCEPAERGTCREDCARYDDVPVSWLDDPTNYRDPRDRTAPEAEPSSPGCSTAPGAASLVSPWGWVLFVSACAGGRRRFVRARLHRGASSLQFE